jgi:hypothetical protein
MEFGTDCHITLQTTRGFAKNFSGGVKVTIGVLKIHHALPSPANDWMFRIPLSPPMKTFTPVGPMTATMRSWS